MILNKLSTGEARDPLYRDTSWENRQRKRQDHF